MRRCARQYLDGLHTGPMYRLLTRSALLLGLLVAVAPTHAAVAGPSTPPLPSFGGCSAVHPEMQPTQILVGCGDGGFSFNVIRWSLWTATNAAGEGLAYVNRCTPDCAAGKFITYRIAVRLSHPRRCSNGRVEFTRLDWRPIGGRPPKLARSGTARSPWGHLPNDHVTCT